MRKTRKILLLLAISLIALILKSNNVKAAEYKWPVGGTNANETYIDYEFYGNRNAAPIKDGKSGREYIVDNEKWPDEKYYYSKSESHYGMDITGINGHTYSVISVVDGTVIATSANRIVNPSVNYVDRNRRRTSAGLRDGGGYGNYIVIQETSTGRCFLYAHLKGGSLQVTKGSKVTVGQEIATMGSSGDSGHMHLHFEIRKSRSVMLNENRYGRHSLYITNSRTNLDPKDYIGDGPVVEENNDKNEDIDKTPDENKEEEGKQDESKKDDNSSSEKDINCPIKDLATPDKLKELGDLNANGIIDTADASIILRMVVCGTSTCKYAEKYADVDCDGQISTSDSCYILMYVSNLGVGNFTESEKPLSQFVKEM